MAPASARSAKDGSGTLHSAMKDVAGAPAGPIGPSSADPASGFQGPFEFNASGAQRPRALVYLPSDYRAGQAKALPLVVLLHGYTGTAEGVEWRFGLSRHVSSRGFILLVPQGIKDREGDTFWNATDSCCDFYGSKVDDVGYLLKLVREIQDAYRIDAKRIYAFGHSNGGFMANRLGCETGSVFAGLASLAGAGYLNPGKCRVKSPISMLQIHALDDEVVRYDGSPNDYPGARPTIAQWLERNGCSGPAVSGSNLDLVETVPGLDTHTEAWDSCLNGTRAALWTIRPPESATEGHNPHSPKLTAAFTGRVLDFLLASARP